MAKSKGWDVPKKDDSKTKFMTQDEKLLDLVVSSYKYSRGYFAPRFNSFRSFMKLYRQITDPKPRGKANLFIPLVYPIVSTILPRMVANVPKFRYEPREESDMKQVEQVSKLVDYQLDRMDFIKKERMWVKDALMLGTGLVKVFWKNDPMYDYNDPDLELIDLLDFFPDPKSTDIQAGDFMIHRTIQPLAALKRAEGPDGKSLYNNLEGLTTYGEQDPKSSNNLIKGGQWSDVDAALRIGSPYRQSKSKQIEVLEYWGINPDEDDKEWVIVVANGNTVIRAEENPLGNKRPFIKMHVDPLKDEFYGIGLIEPIEHLQLELNDTRNQRMDNVNLILNRMWLVMRGANVDETELVSTPGGVIFSDVLNGVQPLVPPDVTQSAYQEEALIKQDAQMAVGVSDIINGQLQSANENVPGQVLNKTATGARVAVEQAGSRFKYYLQNIEDALRELGEMLYMFDQMFMSDEKFIRITAPNDYQKIQKQGLISKIKEKIGMPVQEQNPYEFIRISPEDIKNLKLDIKVEAGSTQPVEESLKQQKALSRYQLIASLPVATGETHMALAEELLEAYDSTNKEKIMKTLQVPQSNGPKTNVSVSLKGDLNQFQAAEIAKAGTGAGEQSADPKLVAQLMASDKQSELVNNLIKDSGKFKPGTTTTNNQPTQ